MENSEYRVEPVAATQEEALAHLKALPPGITFIHGKAGCGKTYLIRQIEKQIEGCQVLAPTNLAASLYKSARTLHSFFHSSFDSLDIGVQDPRGLTLDRLAGITPLLQGIRMLVFDEVSMIRSDTFEMMHRICSMALGNDEPFGGIPTVVVGDLFQLPPVTEDPAIDAFLMREYGGIHFFHSHVVQQHADSIRLFELTKSYRQKNDLGYVRLLDAFRSPLSPERKMALLDALNSRVTDSLPDDAIYLASSNEQVSQVNARCLDRIPSPLRTVDAAYKAMRADGSGYVSFTHSDLPVSEDIVPLVVPSRMEGRLMFKVGARVMLCNSNRRAGYLNGDFAEIVTYDGRSFLLKLEKNGKLLRFPSFDSERRHRRFERTYDEASHKLKSGRLLQETDQYALKLGYAFTIHKSQGQTYDKVILDLHSHIFAPGQLYVALSRVKSMEGLYLTHPITYSDIISDESVFDFLNRVRLANGGTPHGTPPAQGQGDGGAAGEPEADALPEVGTGVNPRCDDFITFVRLHEPEDEARAFLCHTLRSYRTLFAHARYGMAHTELLKVTDLITSAYATSRYDELTRRMGLMGQGEEECRFILNAIFEIYTDVVRGPRRQVRVSAHFAG